MVNTDVASTVAFQFDRDFKVDPRLLLARLTQRVDRDAVATVDASAISATLMGDTIGATLLMLGVASQRGLLPVTPASLEAAVRLNGVAVPMNLRAFRLGRLQAHDPDLVASLMAHNQPPKETLPRTLDELVASHSAHLAAYQDERLASRYRALVAKVAAAEEAVAPGSQDMALAVARSYVRLLAYKDEYEVARMLSDPALAAEIRSAFKEGAKLSFNLAPPILGGRLVNGRPPKREFSVRSLLPTLRVLARMKRIRGTALDPFGRSAERRMERALITEYEALVDRTLRGLTRANHKKAALLLGLADQVRGFGPVKVASVEAYRSRLSKVEAAFSASEPPALAVA